MSTQPVHSATSARAAPGGCLRRGKWMILTLALALPNPSQGQVPENDVVDWARMSAMPLATVEPGSGFEDLRALKPLLDDYRIIALGEAVHGAHEFLALRNRLFEFLVEELGFTAIAVETGFTEAWAVDEYVQGGHGSDSLGQNVFHWAGEVWLENNQLINWMRAYNSRPSTDRKIRFYGIDLTGGRMGLFTTPRRAADAAVDYLARVDLVLYEDVRRGLERHLAQFDETIHATLDEADQNALTAALADLVSVFDREKLNMVAKTGEQDYDVARREAVIAQRVDAVLRSTAAHPGDARNRVSVRDQTMASNVDWFLEREGHEGKLFVFAHNVHVAKRPMWPDPRPSFPNRPSTWLGEFLSQKGANPVAIIGTAFDSGRGLEETYEQADEESFDGLLANVGLPVFALSVRSQDLSTEVLHRLRSHRRARIGNRYGERDHTAAFDLMVFVDTLTPARRAK